MTPRSLQRVALVAAEKTSVEEVLGSVVEGLAAQPGIALARVWMLGPGDLCSSCAFRSECPDRSQCLHLVASAGRSRDGRSDWNRTDGAFRRLPIGARKIGEIAAKRRPFFVGDLDPDDAWIAHPEWIKRERIQSFGGHPLVFRGELLGVLAVFNRSRCDAETFTWLGLFASHAAAALANGRALAEVERLRQRLEVENDYLREEVRSAAGAFHLLGDSPALAKVREQIELVAPTEAAVLVLGETGVGKELVAREVHERSRRASRPFVKVNAAAVPREVFESELFGHVKGAFTGAMRDRAGRFQAADGGTLFLDEIGEVSIDLQPKLLRALQEGEIERVGEDRPRKVDVRVVAATNRDLAREVDEGRFRKDLFYRLSVFPIEVPPLREHPEDVPVLASRFVEEAARRLGIVVPRPSAQTLGPLAKYSWPGNVRELQNAVERAVITSRGGPLRFELGGTAPAVPQRSRPARGALLTEAELVRLQKDSIEAALARSDGRVYGVGGAADLLGLPPTTLFSRMKALRIQKRR